MVDRRNFPRRRKRLTVEYVHDGSTRTAFTTNLSNAGLFVASNFVPPVGKPLGVKLTLTGGKKIPLEGTVGRGKPVPTTLSFADPGGFSFQLDGYSEDYARYLATFES